MINKVVNKQSVFFVLLILSIIFILNFVVADKVKPEVERELRNKNEVPVIVKFRDSNVGIGTAYAKINFKSAKEELKNTGFKESLNLESFNAVAGNITKESFEELKENPDVEEIQLDHKFAIAVDDSVNLINASLVHTFVLNNNITGLNLGVCILDTGVNYSHTDFGGCFGNGCKVVSGYDVVNNDNDPYDDHGHGTHVTGIVNMAAPNASLIHIKVLNSGGGGSESGISAGIDWCVNNKTRYNITAISMSIGSDSVFSDYCDSTFTILTAAINNAIKNNIMVFAASGNNGASTGITSPGCIRNVTSVGSTKKDDTIAGYSNKNTLLDLLAPGSDITSTSMSGGYISMSGTSMATPHASGAAALLQQYSYEQDRSYLNPYQVQDVLNKTGRLIENWRRINVKDAISNIDRIYPEIYINQPVNGTKYNSMNNISLNFTARDMFLSKSWYNIDNLNNISLDGNISFFPLGGNHLLTLFVNDSKGNTNFSNVNLGLDIPRVILNSPEDNLNNLNGNLLFNCTASDLTGLINISLIHNLTGEWLINQTKSVSGLEKNVLFSLNLSGNQTFGWNCISYDTDGFFGLDINRTVRVNFNNIPRINSFFPNVTNVTITEPVNQSFNISYSDANGDLVSVGWYLNNSLVSVSDNYTFISSYTSSGTYNITVYVNDSIGYNFTYWNLNVVNLEFCGDNIKNSTEACDGNDFGGDSCSTRGYNSGSLICNNLCSSIDATNCENVGSGGGGGGGGSGGGTPVTNTENLEPAPTVKSQPNLPNLETASENVEVKEEAKQEEKKEEPEKVEFIKNEGFFDKKINKIIAGVITGVLVLVSLLFFFKKEYLLIKSKNRNLDKD
ncbi:MAG: S8 family serine peptidase [Nanoarchaeota archaeon]